MIRMTEESPESRQKSSRVFFAIWPDSDAKTRLVRLGRSLQGESGCTGRATKVENIHLTLVFVGEVEPARLATLCRVAGEIPTSAARAFDLMIEKIGYWKHKGILYTALGSVPDELLDLVSTLRGAVADAGFVLESRPYVPHVTLMRNASCPSLPELMGPIRWQVREWMLVRSEQTSDGPIYAPVGRWPLIAPE